MQAGRLQRAAKPPVADGMDQGTETDVLGAAMSLSLAGTGFFDSKRRTRAVNFRLSEEEFAELKRACEAEGARSLSDFARTAVWRMIAGGLGSLSLSAVTDRLDKLQQQLSELAGLVRASDSSAAPGKTVSEPSGQRAMKSSR